MFPGTPSSQSSRDPSRETSRDPSPTQYLHNQYRPQLPRPPMPPINRSQSPTLLPPARTAPSQPYSPVNPYSAHQNQYAAGTQANSAVNAPSAAFASQPSQEIQHRPMIPTSQLPPSVAKTLSPESARSADTVKSEPPKASQSYQWTTSPPVGGLGSVPRSTVGAPGISSSVDKTSQVYTDQTAGSQMHARISKPLTNEHGQPVPPITSNVSLPPSSVAQHLNENSHAQQDLPSVQSSRLRNIQAQSTVGPAENPSSLQPKYGTRQNVLGATPALSTPSAGAQNLFAGSEQPGQNVGPRNPQDYPAPLKPQQNLLTGYMDPAGLGNITQGQYMQQSAPGQRRYPPQQDTANTAMPSPKSTAPLLGSNQLHGARPPPPSALPSSGMPPSGVPPLAAPGLPPTMPPLPGHQMVNLDGM